MSSELSKTYDPHAIQQQIDAIWTERRAFHAEPADGGKPYSIVIPPPNVTAALHLGHALNNTLQDILIRLHRMMGDNTCWLPGTDHAGIATQTVVEKRVLKEEGKRRTDFPRDVFVQKIQSWKDEYEQVILGQLRAMGCSCDWDRTAFTMDEPRARAVREAFFQLFKDGLIYRGKRLVNWDPVTQTALADDEVENEEVDGFFYYLRYPLADDPKQYVTVATTRPETMLGDTAVGVNPTDPRAAALRGRFVRLPIVNRDIPIIEDDYVVKPVQYGGDPSDVKAQLATGFLKVTPGHDPNDWQIGQRHNLPVINVLAPDATISDQHGWSDVGGAEFLLGLDRYEAREAVVEWFRQNNLLEDVKPYRHSVGHSYRSHVAIEPYLSDQWYLKVTDDRLAGRALRALAPDQRTTGVSPVPDQEEDHGPDARGTQSARAQMKEGGLRFYPARYAKTYASWNENIRDWCISRQLWWGHRIPVWRLTLQMKPQKGKTDDSRLESNYPENPESFPYSECAAQTFINRETGEYISFLCPPPNRPDLEQALDESGCERDPDVLDTWFSSGLWPMSTLGWPDAASVTNQQSPLAVWNPTSVLCTAREIITLWVSRMVMFNLYFLDRLPFTDVFIHAMIQDGEGRKMSKSLGNGVDPLDIIASHGADAMRFTLASMATNTQDVRMPVEKDPTTGKNTSPKFDIGRNFCNKVWNAARFVLGSLEDEARRHEGTKARRGEGGEEATSEEGARHGSAPIPDPSDTTSCLRASVPSSLPQVDELKWSMADRWIVSRLNRTIAECNESLADYRFDQYAKACYDFFWRDFCDWYVEASKPAMKNPQTRGQTANVLASVLDASLRLMHPMIPYITEALWAKLNEVRPARGIPGRVECPAASGLITRAPWPAVGDFSEAAEFIFPRLQEVVVAIRNVRNDYKIDPRKPVAVSIKAPGDSARQITLNQPAIEILATCTLKDVRPDLPPVEKAAKTSASGCEIYIEGLVDEAAERERVTKRRAELEKQVAALKGRLANTGYIAKAPAHLVQQTKDQLAAAEAELAKLGSG